MSRIEGRVSKVEQDRFGKPGDLTMTEVWVSSDGNPDGVVVSASVFGGGQHATLKAEGFENEADFWAAVEEAHRCIHGRPVSEGKSFKSEIHFE